MRDIGTGPIEDESFNLHDLSRDDFFNNLEILAIDDDPDLDNQGGLDKKKDETDCKRQNSLVKNLHAHNMLLLTKPATGWSQHRP